MIKPLKITFYLDGTGVLYDPLEPIHLDALLAYCHSLYVSKGGLTRDEIPQDIPIPVSSWRIKRNWGYCCSALFPEGDSFETVEYVRKRFRSNKSDLTTGSPSLGSATYREYNIPLVMTVCNKMSGYALGNRKMVKRALRRSIKHLGNKRSIGRGRVLDIDVEECDEDYSLVKNGKAMRFMPALDPNKSVRLARIRPPYWHSYNSIPLCEIGDDYPMDQLKIEYFKFKQKESI